MTRFIAAVLGAATACATTRTPPVRPKRTVTAIPVATWYERWEEARTCLVAPAEDLQTGVAIAMQLGRECSRLLGRLDVQIAFETPIQEHTFPVLQGLVRMVGRELFSPSKRAAVIHDVDGLVQALQGLDSESR